MKDKIRVLPEKVANQIAAGEVVNRSASVVKEMMENAIDAGATEVIVNYRRGGEDLIQIVDNGSGMSTNDARLSFERHATSKITKADDIYQLHTFGFRGEALASIAAVAQVELRTRQEGDEMGSITTINGGEFIDQQPIVCNKGSLFFIRNLFYNVPARRNFLERDSTKQKCIKEEFQRVVLCNHDVKFELYGDDAPIYVLPATSLAGRIVDVIGTKIRKNLLEVSVNSSIVKITGYIGRPDAATKSTANQFTFVNGRYFRSAYLNKAVCKAYEKLIREGYNPAYFLFLEVEPDRVDVNIHPQKTEVKFADESAVWQIINAGVRETMAKTGVISMMEFNAESNIDIPVLQQGVSYAEPRAMSNNNYNPFDLEYTAPIDPSKFEDNAVVEYENFEATEKEVELVEEMEEIPSKAETKSYVEFEEFESSAAPTKYTPLESAPPSTMTHTISSSEWSNIEFEDEEETPVQSDLLESYNDVTNSIEVGDICITNGRYAWCKIGGSMTVVDLRRAKERLQYDYYLSTYSGGKGISQQILFPIEIMLTRDEVELMRDHAKEFSAIGFDIEYSKTDSISINGLPADVKPEAAKELIEELIQTLSTPTKIADELHHRVARVMAHSSANSLGRNIAIQQAKEIVEQLLRSGHTGHTASGKAIVWEVSREDIKQHLK